MPTKCTYRRYMGDPACGKPATNFAIYLHPEPYGKLRADYCDGCKVLAEAPNKRVPVETGNYCR